MRVLWEEMTMMKMMKVSRMMERYSEKKGWRIQEEEEERKGRKVVLE